MIRQNAGYKKNDHLSGPYIMRQALWGRHFFGRIPGYVNRADIRFLWFDD
jgi:hypothetical protein